MTDDGDRPRTDVRLGMIGAGRVGTSLIRALHRRGYAVAAVASRQFDDAVALARLVDAQAAADPAAVVLAADLTIVAVPDDALSAVVGQIVETITTVQFPPGRMVVHTSGGRDAAVLGPLAQHGARIGGLHPALPIAAPQEDLPSDVVYAVEAADDGLRAVLHALVAALDGRAIVLPPGAKARYHAGLVFASNYGVTLYAIARELLRGVGADTGAADAALLPLMRGMLENISARGLPDALTGPLARGDAGTITQHLDALRAVDPALVDLYRALALATFPLLTARGLPDEALDALRAALGVN